MSETCGATKANGEPCAARPLPKGDFCLFHDPAHQQSLTESRGKGGSTPRRRFRRFPRLLDYEHVGELLGELLIEALNDPAAFDPPRLRAITGVAQVLLKAVGFPKDSMLSYHDRTEPAATEDHLLRLYPADPPHLASLLAAESAAAEVAAPDPSIATEDPPPTARAPKRVNPRMPAPALPQKPAPEPDYDAWEAEFERRYRTPPEPLPTAPEGVPSLASPAAAVAPDWALQGPEPADEQVRNTHGSLILNRDVKNRDSSGSRCRRASRAGRGSAAAERSTR